VHLADYVMYRLTRSNIGPWGRSGMTEKRPMYLSPDLGARVPLPGAASAELTGVISRLEEDDDLTSASPDIAARFLAPDRANDLLERTFTGAVQGRGLFAGSDVWITRTAARTAGELLRRDSPAELVPAADHLQPLTDDRARRSSAGRIRASHRLPRPPAGAAMSSPAREEGIPSGLITAVVNLVGTGLVPLGAYTSAEIFSVGGLTEFLEVRIDALGIHFYSLRNTEEAIKRLLEQLPDGDRGARDADLDAALAASPKTALLTVTRWQDAGERESTDVILAGEGDRLHIFLRDSADPKRFVAQGMAADEVRTLLERLIAQLS
jgi:hypothetical protein